MMIMGDNDKWAGPLLLLFQVLKMSTNQHVSQRNKVAMFRRNRPGAVVAPLPNRFAIVKDDDGSGLFPKVTDGRTLVRR